MNKLVTPMLALLLMHGALSFSSVASANHDLSDKQDQQLTLNEYSPAKLAQLLAPIALYPDSLLTHILIASTYPLEIVQAERWLKSQGDISASLVQTRSEDQDWDASVKALLPFVNVLNRLNENLSWTQQLGEAFLADESAVLISVQTLRHKAQEAGHLDNMNNMQVSYEDNSIVIEPSSAKVVYVPYYDSRVVYGNWHWRHHPPVYWVTPKQLYSNGYYGVGYSPAYASTYSVNYQPFYWHSAVHITNHLFFGAVHWHNRHVVIVNPIYRYPSVKRHYSQRPKHYSRQQIISSHSAKRWKHKPHHRRGVSYQHKPLVRKYNQKVYSTSTHRQSTLGNGHRYGYENNKSKVINSGTFYSSHKSSSKKRSLNKNSSHVNNRHVSKNHRVNKDHQFDRSKHNINSKRVFQQEKLGKERHVANKSREVTKHQHHHAVRNSQQAKVRHDKSRAYSQKNRSKQVKQHNTNARSIKTNVRSQNNQRIARNNQAVKHRGKRARSEHKNY